MPSTGAGAGAGALLTTSSLSLHEARRAAPGGRRLRLLTGLAEPGQTGTLKGRMLGTAAEGRLHGKTGTGEGAVALSGVCGELVMSLLVEDMKSRRDDVRAVLDACAIVLSSLA